MQKYVDEIALHFMTQSSQLVGVCILRHGGLAAESALLVAVFNWAWCEFCFQIVDIWFGADYETLRVLLAL